ncbi:sodium:solute symporter family protein [Agarivorans sp.]|uniref:sodium:solute symporter family protein n=1 Tax=Agarivorans sp. TaxID=1872412 RepID=UPI003CFBCF09
MDIQTWAFVFIASSFTLYLIIAVWAKAFTTGDFYVASGRIHPLTTGMAGAANWMSAASFISLAGMISLMGYDSSVYLMGWTGGFVLLALLLAPYLKRLGEYTVAGFFARRFGASARIVAVVFTVFISFIYVAGQMRGVGLVFARFLDVDISLGVLLGVIIVFVYAVWGGMKGITYTQVAQYCVLIFAFLLPAFFTSFSLTGQWLPQLGLGANLHDTNVYLLDKLDALSVELGFSLFTESHQVMLDRISIAAALMMGTAGLPHVIIRFYTVARVKDTRISIAYALAFIALLYSVAPAVGAFAKVNIIQSINGSELLGVAIEQQPAWLDNWQQLSLVNWSDNNGDQRLFYSGDLRNEVFINPDIVMLASPELADLPNWVVALLAAGGLAAALSTAAGLVLVISSTLAHDLVKQTYANNLTERQELKIARISVVLVIVAAGYLGVRPPALVTEVVAIAFGLAASTLFPALILGIFVRRIGWPAVLAGMLVGFGFSFSYIVFFKFLAVQYNYGDYWLLGISPEGIGSVGMLLNFAIALLLQYKCKPAPLSAQAMVLRLRRP